MVGKFFINVFKTTKRRSSALLPSSFFLLPSRLRSALLPSSFFPLPSATRPAFTLVELLVVIGMVVILMGAMTTAVQGARERARMQKAASDVKVITQAILAYEIWNGDELPLLGSRGKAANGAEANASTLGFLVGKGSARGVADGSGNAELPVLLMAQLRSGGAIADPWGTPYRVTIAKSSSGFNPKVASSALSTRFWLPNLYRNGE